MRRCDTPADSLEQLGCTLAEFAWRRAWDPFHSPQQLSRLLIAEAANRFIYIQSLVDVQSRKLSADKLA